MLIPFIEKDIAYRFLYDNNFRLAYEIICLLIVIVI